MGAVRPAWKVGNFHCAMKRSDINMSTKEFDLNRLKGCDGGPHELYNWNRLHWRSSHL